MNVTLSPRSGDRAVLALFVVFFIALQFVLRAQPFSDPGALWHTRVGDQIIAEGFMHTDPFTWSHAGQFWVPQQWLGECVMSIAHRIGGFDTMLTMMNALLAGFAAWVGKRFIDGGLHPLPAGAIVALGMAVAGFHFYLRPHLATIVLMGVVTAWLVDFERRRIGIRRMAWLIPICILWTNLHGGVLGGIATIALAVIGWAILRERTAAEVFWLVVIIFGCAIGTLMNPLGFDMHRTWLRILDNPAMKEFVPEHYPLSIARTDGQAVIGFGVFYLFMLAGTLPRRPRVTWLLPLVWLALSFMGIRHGPLFVAVGLIALADMLPETRWFRLLKKYGDTFAIPATAVPRRPGLIVWLPALALIGIAVLLQRSQIAVPVIGYDWAQFDMKLVPTELIEPLQEYAKTKPDRFPIFNDANAGGFIVYFAPSLTTFMDDRFELYGDAGLRDYIDLMHDHPERIETLRKKVGFDRAIVDTDTVMDDYLKKSGRWKEVRRGNKAVMYEYVR